mmetsp:Transcript_501/g.1344  ORF Transcript_501/g.1344 Transcript_501/m.1344 type:complete len:225 (-) Transcript_501:2535-3209(-)
MSSTLWETEFKSYSSFISSRTSSRPPPPPPWRLSPEDIVQVPLWETNCLKKRVASRSRSGGALALARACATSVSQVVLLLSSRASSRLRTDLVAWALVEQTARPTPTAPGRMRTGATTPVAMAMAAATLAVVTPEAMEMRCVLTFNRRAIRIHLGSAGISPLRGPSLATRPSRSVTKSRGVRSTLTSILMRETERILAVVSSRVEATRTVVRRPRGRDLDRSPP